MKGAAGLRFFCLRSTCSTVSAPCAAASRRVRTASARAASVIENCSIFSPANSMSRAGETVCSRVQVGFDGPVFARLEAFDLFLAFHDQPQGGALHPAGRQTAAHLAPQQGRQVEAHQIVQRAPGLLGVDEVGGDVARVLHRLGDGTLSDLVKHHALHRLALEQTFFVQKLLQMPGDRLAFAVGVGREVDDVGLAERAGNGIQMLAAARDGRVLHGKAVRRIDGAFLGHQVADMTVGGQDLEVLPEVLVDGLGFGGRFDDEEVVTHGHAFWGGWGFRLAAGNQPPGAGSGGAADQWNRPTCSSNMKSSIHA